MKKQKLAIVGTGIAGMGAAHRLQDDFEITLFEKNNYIGGHTNTVFVDDDGIQIPIDTGFIVFNKVTYPNLLGLFRKLNVPFTETDMSFSVQHIPSLLEYNGSGLNGLFSQRKNIFNPSFLKMIWQINRFNKESVEDMESGNYDNYPLEQYLKEKKYGDDFKFRYLIPMSSAIWSSIMDQTLQFPFITLVRFFKNHGMLGLNTQHQWYTVVGGSETYKKRLIEPFKEKIFINKGVERIVRGNEGVDIHFKGSEVHRFDKVVIAAHADEALQMLDKPLDLETRLLSPFKYQRNVATLHTDAKVMPVNRKVWSAWNYRMEKLNNEMKASTIYYMNQLQKVSDKNDYFLSINNPVKLNEKQVLKEFIYHHPIFSLESLAAQNDIHELNKTGPVYFCGSYFKYGFHEDALTSGIEVSKKIIEHKNNRANV